jgi:predicted RNA polymerase sigma factor
MGERLASVLEVIYLVFNEGYTATAGDDWMRPALTTEALRLGRMLADLAPDVAEVHGLLALMELQASRTPARLDAEGKPVLLMAQDRSPWDAVADPQRAGRVKQCRRTGQRLCPAHGPLCPASCHCSLPRPRTHG